MHDLGLFLLVVSGFGVLLVVVTAIGNAVLGSPAQRDARHRADLGDKWWHG